MKICLIGTLPEEGRDALHGPERTTIGLAEALAKEGNEVTVVADEGDETTVNVPAHVFNVQSPPGIRREVELALRTRWRFPPNKFDVVHSWRPALGADVLSLHGIAMAEQVQAALPGTFSRNFVLGAKLDRWAKLLTTKQARRTVVTAPRNRRDAERYGFNVDHVVPVGIDQRFLQPDESDGSDGVDVFYVARIEPRKQPHFVAEETPSNFTVEIAGPNGDTKYHERHPEIDDYWRGCLSTGELLRTYRRARIFVLPSVFEPFGINAVEAMAAGTPLVVADSCAMADFVKAHGIGAVYKFDDGDSYRRALSTVSEDRNMYATAAKQFVRDRLTWERIAEEYVGLYQELPKQ